ncbi:hypothetical protein PsalMR5_01924 [Piscirickettsia salmonis]|nr:hypothetical protein [Piscirickettsia salmonis]QGP54750.1 hypothetical protein PsalSR1_02191 [Piscirickettsia salmonis]QGP59354.1 hypothetical protein PsalBI1_01942 [Piscirickettsia salmonis]QGP64059.1 hypothetical protein PsalMR5_01924 [Piscirickettsia salmonis]
MGVNSLLGVALHMTEGDILTAMVRYGDVRLPIAYEVIEKTIRYSDLQTKKERRKSSFTKNDLFLKLLNVAIRNDLKFAYVCSGQVKQDTFLREFSKLTGDRYSFAV